MTDRLPPHDLVAEQAVLGSLLINRDAIASLADWLKPEAFFDDRNRKVYLSLLWLWNKRSEADVVTLSSELRRVGKLDAIGGEDYLSHLITICPGHWKLPEYAETVRSCAEYRAMIDAATTTIRRSYNREGALDDVVADFRQAVEPFAAPGDDGFEAATNAETLDDHALKVVDRWEGRLDELVVSTGIRSMDRLTYGGFRAGELVILGGRPGMGKTSLVLDMAKQAARRTGRMALIASLEMSREAMHNRMICAEAGIPFWVPYATPDRLLKIEDYQRLPEYKDRFLKATDDLRDVPMAIVEKPRTTDQIRSYLEEMPRRYGMECGVIFIDHLGKLMDGVKGANAEQETAKRTGNAHRLGKDAGVPVVLLSQLSRAVEAVKPFTPSLEHLRYSGAIEQDADYVLLLYRRAYYVEKHKLDADPNLDYCTASDRHRVELYLAKNRNGEVRTIDLGWQPQSMTFHEVAA